MKSRVLIVDDNRMDLILQKFIMESNNYKVDVVSDCISAMSLLIEKNFDLILLDINMPSIDGIDLLQTLKNSPMLKETPVIMLTGNIKEATMKKCSLLGADGYITKPLDFDLYEGLFRDLMDEKL